MTMTCIRILAGVLFLSALAESAIVDRWEYREVYFQKINETSEDFQELEALLEEEFPDTCTVCKWIVETVKQGMGSNTDPGLIRKLLHAACDNTSDFVKSLCKILVTELSDKLVDELSKTKDNAPHACYKLKACKHL